MVEILVGWKLVYASSANLKSDNVHSLGILGTLDKHICKLTPGFACIKMCNLFGKEHELFVYMFGGLVKVLPPNSVYWKIIWWIFNMRCIKIPPPIQSRI